MGAYASSFVDDVGGAEHPKSSDWITSHALLTHLAIVEVERLWRRFQQLGCNEAGVLENEALSRPPASNNVFIRNILMTLRSADGNITFRTFLNIMKWAEMTEQDNKIRGIFYLLNGGAPVPKDILLKVFTRIYKDETEQSVRQTVDVVMEQVDDKRQGFITEDQFVRWVHKLSPDMLAAVLCFDVVPPDITRQAHQVFAAPVKSIPTDTILMSVARAVEQRDWLVLVNRLGFTASDIHTYETHQPGNVVQQVFAMLQSWRLRDSASDCSALETALRESDMTDLVSLLYA